MNIRFEFIDSHELQKPDFQRLLCDEFRIWIEDNFDGEDYLSLAAFYDINLIGLLVVNKPESSTSARVESFQTLLPDRALQNELLSRMEAHLKSKNCKLLEIEFENSNLTRLVLEDQKWQKPRPIYCTYYLDFQNFNPSWFNTPPLPPNYYLLAWNSLSPQQKEYLEIYKSQEYTLLNGPEEKAPVELLNSLILLYKDTIAGWMQNHRISSQTIRYTSLFLFPEHRKKQLFQILLVESLIRQTMSNIPISVFELHLNRKTYAWFNFVYKRLAPHTYHYKETYSSIKIINMLQ